MPLKMEFSGVFDTKAPLPSNFSSKQPSSSDLPETKTNRLPPIIHFTKQPRDMVECFLEITGSRPSNKTLKRYGRMADTKGFARDFFLRKGPTAKDAGLQKKGPPQEGGKARKKATKPDLDFVRRPILVEKHSSDEDELPAVTEDALRRPSKRSRRTLVTQRRARYRRQRAREKKRIEDTKKAFEQMAEAEALEKRKARCTLQPAPTIRPTRGSQLRDQRVLQREQEAERQKKEEEKEMKRRRKRRRRRRDCALRIHAAAGAAAAPCLVSRDMRFKRRSCNPWLDQDDDAAEAVEAAAAADDGEDLESPTEDVAQDDVPKKREPKPAAPPAVAGGTTSKQKPSSCRRRREETKAFWMEHLVPLRVNGGGSLPPFK